MLQRVLYLENAGMSWGSYNFTTVSILSGGTLSNTEGPISLSASAFIVNAGGTFSLANTTTLAAPVRPSW